MPKKSKNTVNENEFLNITKPEVAYVLGLIWADGTLQTNSKYGCFSITCIKEDLEPLKPIFEAVGKWAYYYRTPKVGKGAGTHRREQLTMMTYNTIVYDFLLENNYINGTFLSADKILSKIPDNLKHLWWRGYSDGDGCFYAKQNIQFFFTSSINQDWSFISQIEDKLNIKFKIIEKTNNVGSYSRRLLDNCDGFIKFGNYIYQDYNENKIGFKRKFNIFNDFINWRKNEKNKRGMCVEFVKRNVLNSWVGKFKTNGKLIYVGAYKSKDDAHNAVLVKKQEFGLIEKI